jgi:hypothetical protein
MWEARQIPGDNQPGGLGWAAEPMLPGCRLG